MAKNKGFSISDLTNKGMVEISPGVFQKVSNPQPRDKKTWMQKQEEAFRKQMDEELEKLVWAEKGTKTITDYIQAGINTAKDVVPLLYPDKTALLSFLTPKEYSIEFPVDPMGKPRMTQSDKWKKREVTDRYWQLKDNLKKIAEGMKFTMPDSNYHMIFYIPMPDSWAKSKKSEMNGKPHKQKPDKDNLEKAVLDALCKEDSYVWDGRVTKYWAYKGSIIIKNME